MKYKKQEDRFLGDFLATLAASIMQPVISSVVKGMSGRGVRRAERWYMKEKKFSSAPSFNQYWD